MYLFKTYKKSLFQFSIILLLNFLFVFAIPASHLSAALPADTIEVIAKHPEISKSAIYQINFVVSKVIPSKAILRVLFPAGFDLSDLVIAGSTTINGGFILTVDGQVVTMKRSGLGREIPANEKVDIKFAIVKNPDQPADNYSITVEILSEDNKTIIKEEKKQKILPSKE